ncbi:2-keto-4-pentenoate hydratase [Gordonia bronchialis]|uniref:2-keto-4-pentenoate hydratase n=1 Tax=Gordonia bronchialis TaxID=2054 RepID=UPI0022700DE9|nr:fumarylacetoacetate hydrolase family protein [Gordonia bronchialis]
MSTPASAPPTNASATSIGQAAARLQAAQETGVACAPVRDLIGSRDVATAYGVQRIIVGDRVAAGARVVGRKIGLTAPAVQEQLGVDRPDLGVLLDDMAEREDSGIALAGLLQPKVEAEVAFILGADLVDGDLDAQQVRDAVAYAAPAIEIVDSRIAGWDITFGDTVADNGSSARYVVGAARRSLDDFEPVSATMTMTIDAAQVSQGRGDACLGDPLNALQWLARTAREFGDPLRSGEVILSGALGPMAAITGPCTVRADISGLGTVTATFTAGNQSTGDHQ